GGDLNLAQVFIEQPGGLNSYWNMSDSTDTTIGDTKEHKQLRFLEYEREHEWVFNTSLKDTLFEAKEMTNREAFGDMNLFTSSEYKGATSSNRSQNMRRMQRRSSYKTLDFSQKKPDLKLGRKVKNRPQTTPSELLDNLNKFKGETTKQNYREL